jgi:hypothetical protein
MNRSMKGRALALCAACVFAGTPAAALAWAAGTHAYIAKHSDKKSDLVDANELCNRIYGANATDLFNTKFTGRGQELGKIMHDRSRLVPLAPWRFATGDRALAFAYGMASHNDTWGTDSIAHYAGVTFGREEGYVVAKAGLLAEELGALLQGTLDLPPEALLTVSHVLVEYGIDILVAQADPTISQHLMAATACWAPEGEPPAQLLLLLESLVPELAKDVGEATATAEILEALPAFLSDLGGTGWVLGLPPPAAVDTMAAITAGRAESFLGLPPGYLDAIRPQLQQVAAYGISRGMALCAPDVMAELEATIGRVNGKMSSEGISP